MTPAEVPDGLLLLDTDVFSFLLLSRGRFVEFAALVDGHGMALSFATVGELRAFAIKAKWGEPRRAALELRIRQFVVLPSSNRVTEVYAPLHAKFHGQMPANGANDLWTAACALAHDPPIPVVTNNLKDFQPVRDAFSLMLVHPDI